ncbi:MAG: NADH-quinone oxidoreductase subunit D [Desulfobacteraceae bacterium]|nr:MAG: NADH-quinone oxidoreductase subunit D [Desulfobacteraceae bacterium]
MTAEPITLRKTLTDDTFFLNMGPQHPSTHGVLRLLLKLDGEYVRACEPVLGYSHRGHEHMAQNRTYLQFMPNPSRMDYLSGLLYNDAYCRAVEKACAIRVPERAEYIRAICCELNRISSHLLWFGSYVMDLGGITPFLYAFDDREDVLGILNEVSGSRLTYSYCCFGGVSRDLNDPFLQKLKAFIPKMRGRLKDYDTLVSKNIIFIKRTRDVGVIHADLARDYGLTGSTLRASGVSYDIRKKEPYGLYPEFDFEVPTRPEGDCLARYQVRLAEIEQSLRIVEQALARMPQGPICAENVPQYVTPEPGDYHFSYESARGQVGIYIVSDGSRIPYRMKWRTPSFCNLSILPVLLPGTLVADTIAILGSLDVVIPEIDR